MPTLEEIRRVYGTHAVVSRKGAFTLVHLDRPSRALVRVRTRDFDPESYFFDDCPLCQLMKEGGVIVFEEPFDAGDTENDFSAPG
jgi:hypothetical protein